MTPPELQPAEGGSFVFCACGRDPRIPYTGPRLEFVSRALHATYVPDNARQLGEGGCLVM